MQEQDTTFHPIAVPGTAVLLVCSVPQIFAGEPTLLQPMPMFIYLSALLLSIPTFCLSIFLAPLAPAALFLGGLKLMQRSPALTAALVRTSVTITILLSVYYFVEVRALAIQHQGERHWNLMLLLNVIMALIADSCALSTYWSQSPTRIAVTHFALCLWLAYCALPLMGDTL